MLEVTEMQKGEGGAKSVGGTPMRQRFTKKFSQKNF